MSNVTKILAAIEDGDQLASEELLPLVYDELRRLAKHQLSGERGGHTLQATALVHEAFLRLAGGDRKGEWHSSRHFFAAAAEAMRRVLIDSARHRNRIKRGGRQNQCSLLDHDLIVAPPDDDLLALDACLTELTTLKPDVAEVIKLRFFGGLQHHEIASILGLSTRTVTRHWTYGRAWLKRQLGEKSE